MVFTPYFPWHTSHCEQARHWTAEGQQKKPVAARTSDLEVVAATSPETKLNQTSSFRVN
jgi:hypothetical protein